MFNLKPRVILNKNVHPSFKSILVQDFLKKREILVEGVETQDQLDMLSELSVDYLQGYLFSKPIPKADFIALMRHLHIKQEKALKAN